MQPGPTESNLLRSLTTTH